MMKSTLLISTVLSELPAEVIQMFTNKEAIAIHQDPWGVQARRVGGNHGGRRGVLRGACICQLGSHSRRLGGNHGF